jgi:hypothetical protein
MLGRLLYFSTPIVIRSWLKLVSSHGSSSSAAISWWRWWFVTFASDSHKVMIALIAVLGNKIVITVLKWSGSHNEGANLESFISEVPTLGSIWHIDLVQLLGYCKLKVQNTCWHICMSLDKWLFNLTNLNFFGLGQTSAHVIMGIAQGLK